MAKSEKSEFEKALADLTPLQKLWVLEMPNCNFNQTEAAARAGYKGDRNSLAAAGSRNARNVKVSKALDLLLNERAMSANEVLWRLADQARARYSEYFIMEEVREEAEGDEEGELLISRPVFDFEACKADGNRHLIKKIKYKDGQPAEVEFHDAQTALIKLGQAHGLFKDEQAAVDVNVNVSVAADELAKSRDKAKAFEDEMLNGGSDDSTS